MEITYMKHLKGYLVKYDGIAISANKDRSMAIVDALNRLITLKSGQ